MQNLFIDIETIPTDRADVREYVAAKVAPPGNISKAETIAKWEAESKPGAIEEAIHKTSLDGAFGRVCVICWAVDDGPIRTVKNDTDEELLLKEFCDALRADLKHADLVETAVCGHNVSAFDLRFLVQRFTVNNIIPPAAISRAANAKPWEANKVFDTMAHWAGVGNRVSLEKLCIALSIESPKTGLDGSKVAAAVAAGRLDDVAIYCAGDVEAVRRVFNRLTFAAPARDAIRQATGTFLTFELTCPQGRARNYDKRDTAACPFGSG